MTRKSLGRFVFAFNFRRTIATLALADSLTFGPSAIVYRVNPSDGDPNDFNKVLTIALGDWPLADQWLCLWPGRQLLSFAVAHQFRFQQPKGRRGKDPLRDTGRSYLIDPVAR